MRIMLDTNVLISALIFGGKTGKLLDKLMQSEHELLVTDYVNQEFKDKLHIKWSEKANKIYTLYRSLNLSFCESTTQKLGVVRDEKDVPVLSDALYHHADLILTGDKDFLEANFEKPLVFSPTMLWDFLGYKE